MPKLLFPEYGQSTTPLFLGANDRLLHESLGQATFDGLGRLRPNVQIPSKPCLRLKLVQKILAVLKISKVLANLFCQPKKVLETQFLLQIFFAKKHFA